MAAILFLLPMMLKTSLIFLVFCAGLALVDGRLLKVLFTRNVSRGSVNGLILLVVFIRFLCKPVLLEIFGINLADI